MLRQLLLLQPQLSPQLFRRHRQLSPELLPSPGDAASSRDAASSGNAASAGAGGRCLGERDRLGESDGLSSTFMPNCMSAIVFDQDATGKKGWFELTSKLSMSWHTKTEIIPCLSVPARHFLNLINKMSFSFVLDMDFSRKRRHNNEVHMKFMERNESRKEDHRACSEQAPSKKERKNDPDIV